MVGVLQCFMEHACPGRCRGRQIAMFRNRDWHISDSIECSGLLIRPTPLPLPFTAPHVSVVRKQSFIRFAKHSHGELAPRSTIQATGRKHAAGLSILLMSAQTLRLAPICQMRDIQSVSPKPFGTGRSGRVAARFCKARPMTTRLISVVPSTIRSICARRDKRSRP